MVICLILDIKYKNERFIYIITLVICIQMSYETEMEHDVIVIEEEIPKWKKQKKIINTLLI